MQGRHALVIDAEAASRRLLHVLLTNAGYQVALAASGHEALEHAALVQPDIVVLDPSLPDVDGLQLCRELREWSDVPIIILSADDRERTKVEALDLGVDDYITKPFGKDELVARVRAELRRARRDPLSPVLESGNLRLDQGSRRVTVGHREVHLTPTEYEILKYLMANAGKVATYPMLLRAVWGDAYVEASPILRVFIAQLRRKIEPDPDRPTYILTEPRIGYRFRGEG
jgi:two-component system KDP operon response regulator KdpE